MQVNSKRYNGFYRARVIDNKDPTYHGRIKVFVPDLMEYETDPKTNEPNFLWALPGNNPLGGRNEKHKHCGSLFIPDINAWLWVMFENGDIRRPFYLNAFDSKAASVPPENKIGTEYQKKWTVIRTHDHGRTIVVSDDPADERFEITGKKRKFIELGKEKEDSVTKIKYIEYPDDVKDTTTKIDENMTTILLDERAGKEKLLIKTWKGDFINIDIESQKLFMKFKSDIHIQSTEGSIFIDAKKDINIKSDEDAIKVTGKQKISIHSTDDKISMDAPKAIIDQQNNSSVQATAAKPVGERDFSLTAAVIETLVTNLTDNTIANDDTPEEKEKTDQTKDEMKETQGEVADKTMESAIDPFSKVTPENINDGINLFNIIRIQLLLNTTTVLETKGWMYYKWLLLALDNYEFIQMYEYMTSDFYRRTHGMPLNLPTAKRGGIFGFLHKNNSPLALTRGGKFARVAFSTLPSFYPNFGNRILSFFSGQYNPSTLPTDIETLRQRIWYGDLKDASLEDLLQLSVYIKMGNANMATGNLLNFNIGFLNNYFNNFNNSIVGDLFNTSNRIDPELKNVLNIFDTRDYNLASRKFISFNDDLFTILIKDEQNRNLSIKKIVGSSASYETSNAYNKMPSGIKERLEFEKTKLYQVNDLLKYDSSFDTMNNDQLFNAMVDRHVQMKNVLYTDDTLKGDYCNQMMLNIGATRCLTNFSVSLELGYDFETVADMVF